MKKVLILIFSVMFSGLVFSQTATIGNYTQIPGTVNIPVVVSNFTNIAAITMYFEYDPAVVTYSNFNNSALTGLNVNAYTVGSSYRIGITWSASGVNGSNVSGPLVNIVFNYIGGSSNFTFLESLCDVVDNDYNTVPVIYTNGSIAPLNPATVTIPQFLNQSPVNGFSIPLNVNFSNVTGGVNSFTFIVSYDETKMVYQSATALAWVGIEVIPLTNPTRLAIQWSDPVSDGKTLNGTLLNMVFNYSGGTVPLVFDEANCHIADHNVMEVPGIYTDGLVTQLSPITVTVGTVTAAPGATGVLIPVTVENFSNIGAFDFLIDYNKSILSFTGLTNINPAVNPVGALASNSTTTGVGINWDAALTPLNITGTGKLFDMQFDYTSGTTPLTFDQVQSAVSNFSLNPLTVTYVNGDISEESPFNATAVMPDVVAVPTTPVSIPVTVTGFSDLGAFDLVIGYDGAALTFSAISNIQTTLSTYGTFSYNVTGGKIYVSWTKNPMEEIIVSIPDNATLFNIDFSFIAGNSSLTYDKTLSVVTKSDFSPVNVAYTDGSVSGGIKLQLKVYLEGLYNSTAAQMNKAKDYVSGAVTDRFSGTVADQITVELHDAASYATTICTATNVDLNQDGTATTMIPPEYHGNYYITIKHRNHIETVSKLSVSFAVSNVIYDYTTSLTQAFGNNQIQIGGVYCLFAGDVNQDGYVNSSDRSSVNSKVIAIYQGYVADDVNADGSVNTADRSLVNSGVINIIQRSTP
jgi:hypothetical protein